MALDLRMNPWLSMWVRPRETIRAIVDANPKYRFFVLSIIYGLPVLLNVAQNSSLAEVWPFVMTIAAALILSPLIGLIGITIASVLLYVTGKWVGGKASFLEVRAAMCWSNVTNVANIILWIILMAMFGNALFCVTFPQMTFSTPQMTVLGFIFLAQFVIAIWGFIILLKALGEVQGFSAWKALLNVIIPFAIVMFTVWLVGWIFWSIKSM